jgi:hypothetical protein
MAVAATLPGVGEARKLTDYNTITSLEYGYMQGAVTAKSPKGDSFTVNGQIMFLVEYTGGGEEMVTSFYGPNGEAMGFDELKVGNFVYVYGGALKDDTRAARDVFVTKGKLTPAQRKALFAEKKVKPWKKDIKK